MSQSLVNIKCIATLLLKCIMMIISDYFGKLIFTFSFRKIEDELVY